MTHVSEYDVVFMDKTDGEVPYWLVTYEDARYNLPTQREALAKALELQKEYPGHIAIWNPPAVFPYRIIDERLTKSGYLKEES